MYKLLWFLNNIILLVNKKIVVLRFRVLESNCETLWCHCSPNENISTAIYGLYHPWKTLCSNVGNEFTLLLSSCSNNSERLISKSALIKPINKCSRFYYHILFADNYALVHKCSLPDISIFLSPTSEKLSSSSWLVLNLIPWFPSSFGRLAHNKSISTGRSPVGKDGLQPSQALFCQPHPNCGICSASPLSSSLTVGHVQFHAYLLTELCAFKPHWCH